LIRGAFCFPSDEKKTRVATNHQATHTRSDTRSGVRSSNAAPWRRELHELPYVRVCAVCVRSPVLHAQRYILLAQGLVFSSQPTLVDDTSALFERRRYGQLGSNFRGDRNGATPLPFALVYFVSILALMPAFFWGHASKAVFRPRCCRTQTAVVYDTCVPKKKRPNQRRLPRYQDTYGRRFCSGQGS